MVSIFHIEVLQEARNCIRMHDSGQEPRPRGLGIPNRQRNPDSDRWMRGGNVGKPGVLLVSFGRNSLISTLFTTLLESIGHAHELPHFVPQFRERSPHQVNVLPVILRLVEGGADSMGISGVRQATLHQNLPFPPASPSVLQFKNRQIVIFASRQIPGSGCLRRQRKA